MTDYPIEDGFPIPPHPWAGSRGNTTSHDTLYPLDDLEPGQSFFVPCTDASGSTLGQKMYVAKQRTGHHFTRREQYENGVWGHRIWRILPDLPHVLLLLDHGQSLIDEANAALAAIHNDNPEQPSDSC